MIRLQQIWKLLRNEVLSKIKYLNETVKTNLLVDYKNRVCRDCVRQFCSIYDFIPANNADKSSLFLSGIETLALLYFKHSRR